MDKPIVYLQHPLSAEEKSAWKARGYQILDAKFQPEGFVESVVEQAQDPEIEEPVQEASEEKTSEKRAYRRKGTK